MIPTGSSYCLKYSKGIVRAVPGSFGIMVFEHKKQAKKFMVDQEIILKVRPIGKCRQPKYLSSLGYDVTKGFNEFYAFYKRNYKTKYWMNVILTIYAPIGTECYPAVEVLE